MFAYFEHLSFLGLKLLDPSSEILFGNRVIYTIQVGFLRNRPRLAELPPVKTPADGKSICFQLWTSLAIIAYSQNEGGKATATSRGKASA